jgi:hypothetical protein
MCVQRALLRQSTRAVNGRCTTGKVHVESAKSRRYTRHLTPTVGGSSRPGHPILNPLCQWADSIAVLDAPEFVLDALLAHRDRQQYLKTTTG